MDWDDRRKRHEIFLLDGKNWDGEVDGENGNYDYLMGADLDMGNPEVVEELDRWGEWYVETAALDGLRLDAVKHIFDFLPAGFSRLREKTGKKSSGPWENTEPGSEAAASLSGEKRQGHEPV